MTLICISYTQYNSFIYMSFLIIGQCQSLYLKHKDKIAFTIFHPHIILVAHQQPIDKTFQLEPQPAITIPENKDNKKHVPEML